MAKGKPHRKRTSLQQMTDALGRPLEAGCFVVWGLDAGGTPPDNVGLCVGYLTKVGPESHPSCPFKMAIWKSTLRQEPFGELALVGGQAKQRVRVICSEPYVVRSCFDFLIVSPESLPPAYAEAVAKKGLLL